MVERGSGHDVEDFVSITDTRALHFLQLPDTLDPAFARNDGVRIFADDVGLWVVLGDLVRRSKARSAPIGKLAGHLFEFRLHDFPQAPLGAQQATNPFGLGALLFELFEKIEYRCRSKE